MMAERHLIFLHGALGSAGHWDEFLPYFEEVYTIHHLDFPGHGKSREKLNDYSYASLTDFVKKHIAKNDIKHFSIIGYSMGGYIGLNLLLQGIEGFQSLITLATKVNWNRTIAVHENSLLTMESLGPIIDKLKVEHGDNFEGLIGKTKTILSSIGEQPLSEKRFKQNNIPVTMLLGGRDKMITPEEVIAFSGQLPCFNFEIMENQPHSLSKMDTKMVVDSIHRLLHQTF